MPSWGHGSGHGVRRPSQRIDRRLDAGATIGAPCLPAPTNGANEQVRRREECPHERQKGRRREQQDHERDQQTQAGHAHERDQPHDNSGGDEFDAIAHASRVLRAGRLRIRQPASGRRQSQPRVRRPAGTATPRRATGPGPHAPPQRRSPVNGRERNLHRHGQSHWRPGGCERSDPAGRSLLSFLKHPRGDQPCLDRGPHHRQSRGGV